MFSKYFQSELTFLREMGRAYAEAHPQAAGLLAGRGNDPDVERLFEGFAFLAARIRERVEDGVPEIAHDLAELLVPQSLRPLPAATILEFTPLPSVLRGRGRVMAGAEVASVPVDGCRCRFRTTAEFDVVPASVREAVIERSVSANPVLRVRVEVAEGAQDSVFEPAGLRFFVRADLPVASTLMLWLARHLRGVEVRSSGAGGGAVQLGASAVRFPGFDPGMPLLPWPALAPTSCRTLQEYFTLPQKFLFFEVRGLDAALSVKDDRFEIAFQLERPPELPGPLPRDALRLNCAPVVNVFPVSGDPMSVRGAGDEHLIRAAGLHPGQMSVYSVDQVTGIPGGRGDLVQYEPFSGFSHAAKAKGAAYYRLRRALSPVDGELDTWLSLASPRDGGAGPSAQTLSLGLTCTNRELPARLRLGDVSQTTKSSPTMARFRDIVPVSRPVRPPLGTELHWRLIAQLAWHRAPSGKAEGLRRQLELYNLQALTDEQAGSANRLRIEGVRELEAEPVRRLVQGAPVRGMRVSLDLDESGFASVGDAFLFASALDDLLAGQTPLISFTELAIALQPSQRKYAFPPRNGRRAML
jgi:type VI secretion system protein ImpG